MGLCLYMKNRGETVEKVEKGQFNRQDLFEGLFTAINRTTKKIMAEKTHCSKVCTIFNHLFNVLCHNVSWKKKLFVAKTQLMWIQTKIWKRHVMLK